MRIVLDTNVVIHALHGDARVLERLAATGPDQVAVSAITLAEFRFGARKSRHPERMRRLQDAFLAPLGVLDFTAEAAERYAEIRHHLEAHGTPIGERDQLIASVAPAAGRPLVTANRREFDRVPGLRVVDWA